MKTPLKITSVLFIFFSQLCLFVEAQDNNKKEVNCGLRVVDYEIEVGVAGYTLKNKKSKQPIPAIQISQGLYDCLARWALILCPDMKAPKKDRDEAKAKISKIIKEYKEETKIEWRETDRTGQFYVEQFSVSSIGGDYDQTYTLRTYPNGRVTRVDYLCQAPSNDRGACGHSYNPAQPGTPGRCEYCGWYQVLGLNKNQVRVMRRVDPGVHVTETYTIYVAIPETVTTNNCQECSK